MNADAWHERNARHLSTSLAWLRQRLQLYAVTHPRATPPVNDAAARPAPTRGRRRFGRRLAPDPTFKALPVASVASVAAQVDESAATLAAIEAQEGLPPALVLLEQRLGLSRFERDVLLLCAAMELDTHIAELCAEVQGFDLPHPTYALALALFDDPAWEVVSPERPLRHWRLLEISQPGGRPMTTSPLRADERIVNYLKGLNYLDDRITPLLAPLESPDFDAPLPPSHQELVDGLVARLREAAGDPIPPVVNLLGPDTPSKQLVAHHVVAALGLELLRLPVGLLPTQIGELETLARLWARESILLPVALYLEGGEVDPGTSERDASPVSRFLARSNGLLLLDTVEPWPGLARPAVQVDVAKPRPVEQQSAWRRALGATAGDAPSALATQFDLDLTTIRRLGGAAAAQEGDVRTALWRACLGATRPRLDILATRLEPKVGWADLVLREEELDLLRCIAEHVRRRALVYDEWGFRASMERGLGVTALFAGDSGTGKTMAAGVIANELGLDLYHIDLSAVVSKYIGETEKNLRRLFDAADVGGAILFFDEADALFGKRSEVKDSHDRYANIEINYLLQRMEAYRGLAILATNMKSALDQAFMRRLRFAVDFECPGPEQRLAIWEHVFPAGTPARALDLDRLARFVLTGGSIQSAALAAAFLAASADSPVTMPLVLQAVRREFKKLNRPINEADFAQQKPKAVPA